MNVIRVGLAIKVRLYSGPKKVIIFLASYFDESALVDSNTRRERKHKIMRLAAFYLIFAPDVTLIRARDRAAVVIFPS